MTTSLDTTIDELRRLLAVWQEAVRKPQPWPPTNVIAAFDAYKAALVNAAPALLDALADRKRVVMLVAEAVRDAAQKECNGVWATAAAAGRHGKPNYRAEAAEMCETRVRDYLDLAAIVSRVLGSPVERVWTRQEVLSFGERVREEAEANGGMTTADGRVGLAALLDGKGGGT